MTDDNLLDNDSEITLRIDSDRSIVLTHSRDHATALILVEDPYSVAAVELTHLEMDQLIEILLKFQKEYR